MMRMRGHRLLAFSGLCLFSILVFMVLSGSQYDAISQGRGEVSDITLFPDHGLVVYSQDACADASRFLPLYNPPQLRYLKTQFFDTEPKDRDEPEVQLIYWYPWFGHGFPDFETSFATGSVLLFMGIPLGEDVDVQTAEANPCAVPPPYNLPELPSTPDKRLTRGTDHNGFKECALFCFDADEMRCRMLPEGNQKIRWTPQHFNICRGIFPTIFMTDANGGLCVGGPHGGHVYPTEETLRHSCFKNVLLSLNGDFSVELRDEYRGYNMFVLSNGDIISQWGPNSVIFKEQCSAPLTEFWRHDNWLLHNGQIVDGRVFELLGVTPNTKYVFYSRFGVPLPEEYNFWAMRKQLSFPPRLWSSCTLWIYEPATGERWQVLDEPPWGLRVSRDSRRYGLLEVSYRDEPLPKDWVGHVDFYGARGDRALITINGARIFDLEGNVLEEVSFEKPIVTRAWDWDIDAKIIAYYDAARRVIVVRSLSGEVISEFEP